jgi:hypothetical protein
MSGESGTDEGVEGVLGRVREVAAAAELVGEVAELKKGLQCRKYELQKLESGAPIDASEAEGVVSQGVTLDGVSGCAGEGVTDEAV